MAQFRLTNSAVSRSDGRNAVASAAYRAGENLRSERTGRTYKHAQRQDVLHKEILLPVAVEASAGAWARDRAKLWNAAEKADSAANSRIARELQVSLPHELNRDQQLALARTFARYIAERFNVAVDLAVHAPREDGDPRNFHAHLLTTTREVHAEGLGAKAAPELNGQQRHRRGLPNYKDEFNSIREHWANLTNNALQAANLEVRVDHRSFRDRGMDRFPMPTIPIGAIHQERRGIRSELAERIRQGYEERVRRFQERKAQSSDGGQDRLSQGQPGTESASTWRAGGDGRSLDQIQKDAVAAWRKYKEREAQAASAATAVTRGIEAGLDGSAAYAVAGKEADPASGKALDAGSLGATDPAPRGKDSDHGL